MNSSDDIRKQISMIRLEPVLFFVKHAKQTCSRRIYHISPISFWYFWNYEIQGRWCYFAEFAEYLISLPNGA